MPRSCAREQARATPSHAVAREVASQNQGGKRQTSAARTTQAPNSRAPCREVAGVNEGEAGKCTDAVKGWLCGPGGGGDAPIGAEIVDEADGEATPTPRHANADAGLGPPSAPPSAGRSAPTHASARSRAARPRRPAMSLGSMRRRLAKVSADASQALGGACVGTSTETLSHTMPVRSPRHETNGHARQDPSLLAQEL